jgi:hypothetical protein
LNTSHKRYGLSQFVGVFRYGKGKVAPGLKHHIVKTHKVGEAKLHVFLTLAQDGDKKLTLRCGSFILEELPVVTKEGVGWTEEVAKRKIALPT